MKRRTLLGRIGAIAAAVVVAPKVVEAVPSLAVDQKGSLRMAEPGELTVSGSAFVTGGYVTFNSQSLMIDVAQPGDRVFEQGLHLAKRIPADTTTAWSSGTGSAYNEAPGVYTRTAGHQYQGRITFTPASDRQTYTLRAFPEASDRRA